MADYYPQLDTLEDITGGTPTVSLLGLDTSKSGNEQFIRVGFNNLKANLQSTVEVTEFKFSSLSTPPTSASDTGALGEVRIDADYIYVCTATDTWKRAALTTW